MAADVHAAWHDWPPQRWPDVRATGGCGGGGSVLRGAQCGGLYMYADHAEPAALLRGAQSIVLPRPHAQLPARVGFVAGLLPRVRVARGLHDVRI
jgi:hypothetical protein